jgi:hypothetical protein
MAASHLCIFLFFFPSEVSFQTGTLRAWAGLKAGGCLPQSCVLLLAVQQAMHSKIDFLFPQVLRAFACPSCAMSMLLRLLILPTNVCSLLHHYQYFMSEHAEPIGPQVTMFL